LFVRPSEEPCPRCAEAELAFAKVARAVDGAVLTARVEVSSVKDGSTGAEAALADRYRVKKFPRFVGFPQFSTRGDARRHMGSLSAKALVHFAVSRLPQSLVFQLDQTTAYDLLRPDGGEASDRRLPKVILFSDDELDTLPTFKLLAAQHRGRLVFAEAKAHQKGVARAFSVTRFPSIQLVLTEKSEGRGPDAEATVEVTVRPFTGQRPTHAALRKWLAPFAGASALASRDDEQLRPRELRSAAAFVERCGSAACAVAVLPRENRRHRLQVLQDAVDQAAQDETVGWSMPLFWVRAERHPQIAAHFLAPHPPPVGAAPGAAGDEPGLLVLNGRRARAAVFRGGSSDGPGALWSARALKAFLRRVTRRAEPSRPWPGGKMPWSWAAKQKK
jgi:hypothetical protein